ncbi:MAG: hypothetical protein ACRDM7_20760, partial [Thermoleophilaceae bacterium]
RTPRRRCPVRRRSPCMRLKLRVRSRPAADRLVQVSPFAPSVGAPPAVAPPSTPPPPTLPRFVSVAAREWSLTLSRPLVGAGSVTVELRNVGEDPHNLVVSPDDDGHAPLAEWEETAPGGLLRRSLALPAGRYLLFCSLEGHEAKGMSARLRVE